MPRAIHIDRDEAEMLVELLILLDDRRAADLNTEIRHLFGMTSIREELSIAKRNVIEERARQIALVNVTDLKTAEQYALNPV